MNEAVSVANRALAEKKKFEADAMQFQGEIMDIRQELKIVDERVEYRRTSLSRRARFLPSRHEN